MLIVLFAGYLTRGSSSRSERLLPWPTGSRMVTSACGFQSAASPKLASAAKLNTMAESLEQSRGELAASRTRIVAAGDQARRRIERTCTTASNSGWFRWCWTFALLRPSCRQSRPSCGRSLLRSPTA